MDDEDDFVVDVAPTQMNLSDFEEDQEEEEAMEDDGDEPMEEDDDEEVIEDDDEEVMVLDNEAERSEIEPYLNNRK